MSSEKERVDLLNQKIDIFDKGTKLEFEKMGMAFNKMADLIDLLYLEVAVLLNILSEKKIIDQKTFAEELKKTSDKIDQFSKKKPTKEEPSKIIKPGNEDKKT